MILYSNAALRYAAEACKERPRYKVLIAATRAKRDEAINKIKLLIQESTEILVDKFRVSYSNTEVRFLNGSVIVIVPASGSYRGYKFHLLIADPYCDKQCVRQIGFGGEICEWMDWDNRN